MATMARLRRHMAIGESEHEHHPATAMPRRMQIAKTIRSESACPVASGGSRRNPLRQGIPKGELSSPRTTAACCASRAPKITRVISQSARSGRRISRSAERGQEARHCCSDDPAARGLAALTCTDERPGDGGEQALICPAAADRPRKRRSQTSRTGPDVEWGGWCYVLHGLWRPNVSLEGRKALRLSCP